MTTHFELNAIARHEVGRGASRRLRHNDQVPAIIYGGEQKPTQVSIDHKLILKSLENEAFYSHVITIQLDGKNEKVLLKDLQRHPWKKRILHIDFQRVTGKETLRRQVPLHFLNEDKAAGVKQGGIITHHIKEIEIRCNLANLPEYIAIDMANIALGQTLHLAELVMPNGVSIVGIAQKQIQALPVVTISLPRVAVVETGTTTATAETTATTAEKKAKPEK